MEFLLILDQQLFLLLNHLPHPDWLNSLMLLFTLAGMAGIIWFALGLVVFWKKAKKDGRFLTTLFLAGGLSWIIAERLLKYLIARPRPSLDIGAIIVAPNLSANSYSLPSGHATISWAMAVILARQEPKAKIWFYLLALLISSSRIYLGRHYPLDVVAGTILGWAIGKFSLLVLQKRHA